METPEYRSTAHPFKAGFLFGRDTQAANKKAPGKDFIAQVEPSITTLRRQAYKPQAYVELKHTYLCRCCKAPCRKGTWAFHNTTVGTTCVPCYSKRRKL